MRVDDFLAFCAERESVRRRREAGEPGPWTEDPVLRQFRFCNVRREDDAVTRWITLNWREPHADDPDLWFAILVARHLNLPDALGHLGFPAPWDREHFLAVLEERRRAGWNSFSAAYMIRSDKAESKGHYLADAVFGPMWQQREILRPKEGDTLNSWHMIAGGFYGLGSFLAAQLVADLKYVSPLSQASDWRTFAASGPGSRRGLNRVLQRPVDAPWREDEWRLAQRRLCDEIWPRLAESGLPDLHAQDVQNCLCEFDKYERVVTGAGRPKQLFRPRL